MMHGQRKSDEAIVAMKPVNKGGASRLRSRWSDRAEAKGNAGQTNIRQTQSRGSVSQGWKVYAE